ncbi:nuclear transport factor 2 family protein [bacterium]|nr:nuclear transport factor 2 family protein [bacterium]
MAISKSRQVVENYFKYCNSHDIKGISKVLTTDFVFKTYFMTGEGHLENISSRENYLEGEEKSFENWTGWKIEPIRWIVKNNEVVVVIKQTATFNKTGKKRVGEDVMIITLQEDKIKEICQYYDTSSVAKAIN